MKKIINGRMYSTETATEIGTWWNGYSTRDFNYCKETLYLKATGEFFLYGEGNALSKYAKHYADGWGEGETIKPMTEAEAKKWTEKKLDADKYIKAFGEVGE